MNLLIQNSQKNSLVKNSSNNNNNKNQKIFNEFVYSLLLYCFPNKPIKSPAAYSNYA